MISASTAAWAQPDPLGVLWEKGGVSLLRVRCAPGDVDEQYCRAIALRESRATRILGSGYMHVRLLWSRRGHGAGPDALVFGDDGGSGGLGDLIAISLGPKTIVTTYNSERLDEVRVSRSGDALRLELPFDVEYFNGAPHAGARIVPIPTIWRDGDFSADFSALVQPPLSKQELAFRELAVREELADWAEAKFPSPRLFPPQSDRGTPVTVQALLDLMLTGHADEARELLRRAWPHARGRSDGQLGGEEDFWKAICQAAVHNPLWRRLRLDRLPQADLIRAGAA